MLDKNQHAASFINLVEEAFDSVPQEYYYLTTTYRASGITRERVFCYELYHRIRCLQEIKGMNRYSLHGEVDKSGHSSFATKHQRIPDFVFHIPGVMDHNLLVIEVKGKLTRGGVAKDLTTIDDFCNHYNYSMGLWVVYNYSCQEIEDFLHRHNGQLPVLNSDRVELICKRTATSILERACLSGLKAGV